MCIRDRYITASPTLDSDGGAKIFSAVLSEAFGTFMFVFLFMICTDKKTQFSEDKVINCFIVSGSYIASRLFAGGRNVTGLYSLEPITYKELTGPLLNPALAFGQELLSLDFEYFYVYMLVPFVGTVLAVIFYEFIFVKTQDYLHNSEDGDEDGEERTGKGSKSFPDSDNEDEIEN